MTNACQFKINTCKKKGLCTGRQVSSVSRADFARLQKCNIVFDGTVTKTPVRKCNFTPNFEFFSLNTRVTNKIPFCDKVIRFC